MTRCPSPWFIWLWPGCSWESCGTPRGPSCTGFFRPQGSSAPLVPALLIAGLFLSAQLTDVLGLHAIFGAFLFGLIMPTDAVPVRRLTAMAEGATEWLLLPLFFAGIGTRTDLTAGGPRVLAEAVLVTAVPVVSKVAAGFGRGRLLGMSWRDSTALGVMLNCRGMTELILLSIGRSAGIIGEHLVGIFVIMALTTTAVTGPLLRALQLHPEAEEPIVDLVAVNADEPSR